MRREIEIGNLFARFRRVTTSQPRSLQLTTQRFKLLRAIAENPYMTIRKACSILDVSSTSSGHAHLQKLVWGGWAERVTDFNSPGMYRVTDKGFAALKGEGVMVCTGCNRPL